jgi:hypothetical protein
MSCFHGGCENPAQVKVLNVRFSPGFSAFGIGIGLKITGSAVAFTRVNKKNSQTAIHSCRYGQL